MGTRRALCVKVRPEAGVIDFNQPWLLLFAAAVYLLAGFVKGVIGGGLPAISIGVLGIVMPVPQAAALVVVPSFVTNVWQMLGPRLWLLVRRIWLMLAGICVGAWLGAGIMTGAHSEWARTGLGLALSVYSALGLFRVHLHVRPAHEPWLAPLVGLATGYIAAGTGVFVIPSGPYLQAIGLQKDDMVQALGITYTVSTVVLAGIVAHAQVLQWSMALIVAIALACALVGMALGQKFRRRLPEDTFRTLFFAGLLLLGAYLALHGLL